MPRGGPADDDDRRAITDAHGHSPSKPGPSVSTWYPMASPPPDVDGIMQEAENERDNPMRPTAKGKAKSAAKAEAKAKAKAKPKGKAKGKSKGKGKGRGKGAKGGRGRGRGAGKKDDQGYSLKELTQKYPTYFRFGDTEGTDAKPGDLGSDAQDRGDPKHDKYSFGRISQKIRGGARGGPKNTRFRGGPSRGPNKNNKDKGFVCTYVACWSS